MGKPTTERRISSSTKSSRQLSSKYFCTVRDRLQRLRLVQHADDPFKHPPQGYGSSPSTPGEMINLPPPQHQQHPHPDMYGMRPHDMYAPYPPDPRGIPPPHMGYQSQPAPRQRTAIACRYCRRRKVRFTHSHLGMRQALIDPRFAVQVLKHPMMDAAPTASVSSKNVSSHQSLPRHKPLCQPTQHIHIFATLGQCHLNVVEDQSILSRGSRPSTVRMGSLSVLPWDTTPTFLHHLTAILCHLQGPIKVVPSTMTEVLHSLPMLKIK